MESTVRYLGIAIDDALAIAEQLQGSAALTRRTDAAQASFFDGVGNDTGKVGSGCSPPARKCRCESELNEGPQFCADINSKIS
jgi:hypothetical protein